MTDNNMSTTKIELSAVIAIGERSRDALEVYQQYKAALEKTGKEFEFVFVIDGYYPDILAGLKALKEAGDRITVVNFSRFYGEATAMKIGFETCQGEAILTLPAYLQVEADELVDVVNGLEHADMVVTRRYPRIDSWFNKLQSTWFHKILVKMGATTFKDLGCGVRALKKNIISELDIYGELHRFLPLIAQQKGFSVIEMNVKQAQRDAFSRVYAPDVYFRRVLDLITIVFITKFSRKPLRFFGIVGSSFLVMGFLGMLWVLIARLVWQIPMIDRPELLISAVLFVLGAQIGAIGLLGEMVIFLNSKDSKEYTIREIVN